MKTIMDIVTHEHFELFHKLYELAKDYDAEDDTKNWVFFLCNSRSIKLW